MLKNVMLATWKEPLYTIFFNARSGNFTLREYKNFVDRLSHDYPDENTATKFKGDALEVLAEIFFNRFEADPSVGLSDYTPVSIENDFGVDATGKTADEKTPVVVQVKYRENLLELILYEDMSKTFTSGTLMMNLDLTKPNSLFLFTTASGITPACQKVFGNRIRVLNFDVIEDKIRNNANFWDYAFKEVYDYLNAIP